LGKNTKRPFGSSASQSKEILDLFHFDIYGRMAPTSLGGHPYSVTFIDDHSRKTWVYLMKSKDEVFTKFQEFKSKVDVGNGSPGVNFRVKSPSFGVESPNFVGKNVQSLHFVTVEHEDVSNQKGFSTLSLDSCVGLMRSALGSRTMGLYKKGVLEESKAV